MKKLSSILLVLAVLLLAVSCASLGQKEAKATIIAIDAPASEGDIATVMQLANSEIIRQCFNAVEWHPGYSVKTIVEEDFWFLPEPAELCSTGTFDDTYLDSAPYSEKEKVSTRVFTDKYIAFMKDTGGKYEYDICVGEGQSASYQCYYQCFSAIGAELLIYVPYDYSLAKIVFEELSTGKQMLDADNYIITDVEGKTYTLSKADVENAMVTSDKQTVNIVVGDLVIANAYSIHPETVTKDSAVVENKIMRGVFALCAKSVFNQAPNAYGNVKGSYYNAVQISSLLSQYGVKSAPISAQYNGSDVDVVLALSDRLIHHKSNGFMALRPMQLKSNSDDATANLTSVAFSNAQIIFASETPVSIASLNLEAALSAKKAEVEYVDGTIAEVTVDEALALEIVSGGNIAAVRLF